jgi:hypothetical protein
MAEVNVPIVNTPTTQPFVEQNLKELRLGRGSFSASKEGMFFGGLTSDEAPFFVDVDGNMKATSGVFSGKIEIKDGSGNVVILIDPNASS